MLDLQAVSATVIATKGNKMINNSNIVGYINAYELGELNEEETISFFQKLLDSGLINHLQGHYGRTAAALIANGDITQHYASSLTRK